MGLDMYVFANEEKLAEEIQVDFEIKHQWPYDELCYWRKHPNLHGWMQNLYYTKGGKSENGFNGDNLRLTHEDLDALQKAIEGDALPLTHGFFFGQSPEKDDEYFEQRKTLDLKCIDQIRDALDNGQTVWYTSSW